MKATADKRCWRHSGKQKADGGEVIHSAGQRGWTPVSAGPGHCPWDPTKAQGLEVTAENGWGGELKPKNVQVCQKRWALRTPAPAPHTRGSAPLQSTGRWAVRALENRGPGARGRASPASPGHRRAVRWDQQQDGEQGHWVHTLPSPWQTPALQPHAPGSFREGLSMWQKSSCVASPGEKFRVPIYSSHVCESKFGRAVQQHDVLRPHAGLGQGIKHFLSGCPKQGPFAEF